MLLELTGLKAGNVHVVVTGKTGELRVAGHIQINQAVAASLDFIGRFVDYTPCNELFARAKTFAVMSEWAPDKNPDTSTCPDWRLECTAKQTGNGRSTSSASAAATPRKRPA
jgi:hypothetical protein